VGDRAMEKSLVYAWHKHFNVGHKSVDNDLCIGCPSMPTNEASVQHVREIMRSDRKNLSTKLHQRLEFLLEVVTVFFMMCRTCAAFVSIQYLKC